VNLEITVTGIEDIQRRLSVDLRPALQAAAVGIGQLIRAPLAATPPPAHKPVIWASQRQRRWWFAHRREAGLPLEYTRNSDPESQRIQAKWTVQPTKDGAVVGTTVTYAPWVQSAEKQTEQHKSTGWVTDEEAIRQLDIEDAKRIVTDAIMHALR
jgi:hypothetical protein